jgi:hypothetical protein
MIMIIGFRSEGQHGTGQACKEYQYIKLTTALTDQYTRVCSLNYNIESMRNVSVIYNTTSANVGMDKKEDGA